MIEEGDFVPRDMALVGAPRAGDRAGAAGAAMAVPDDVADPVARLRRLISDRQEETVEILRSWMEDPEAEKA
ncbi:MAG: hypothetical protein ACREIB_06700 [Pseudomonadota bacterium]